jgi:hypothetical protein
MTLWHKSLPLRFNIIERYLPQELSIETLYISKPEFLLIQQRLHKQMDDGTVIQLQLGQPRCTFENTSHI